MARAMMDVAAKNFARADVYLDVEKEWPHYVPHAKAALQVIHDIGV